MTEQKLRFQQLWAYALPGASISALGLPLAVHLPAFYAKEMGVSVAAVGMIFMISRFWDVFTDPMLGVLSDRFPSRWGRRRHWIVLSVPIIALSVFFVFMPIKFVEPTLQSIYLLIWLLFMYIGWTMLTLSHLSWGAELSPNYDERSRIQGAREMFIVIGMVIVLALPSIIEQRGGDYPSQMAAMAWFVILSLPVFVAISVTMVGERQAAPTRHTPWREAVTVLMQNRPLQLLLAADIALGIGGGTVASMFVFIMDHALGLGEWRNVILLVYFLSGFACVPLMIWLTYKLGKHRALCASVIFNMSTLPLLFFLPQGAVGLAFFLWVIFGLNYAATPFIMRAILPDVADHDYLQTGEQRTGLFFSLLTLTNKIGQALAIGIAYTLLGWIGFDAQGENSPQITQGVLTIYIILPTILNLVVVAFMWNFPLDSKAQQDLRTAIQAKTASAGVTPVKLSSGDAGNVGGPEPDATDPRPAE
jgi:Na+/melibiose symporter-like transporter